MDNDYDNDDNMEYYYNDEDDHYYEDPAQSDLNELGDVLNSFNNSASQA